MSEAGIHLLLRYTARTTFALFFFAFTGNALRELWRNTLSAWFARRRNWFLVAMALSHSAHLFAIIALFQVIGWSRLKWTTALGGGLGYLLLYILAINGAVRLKSSRASFFIGTPGFETAALYLIWLIFAFAYVPRIVSGQPVNSLLAIAAALALALRIAGGRKQRRAAAAGA